jgi:glycosyltransferase involved in cell wall biosynthesis
MNNTLTKLGELRAIQLSIVVPCYNEEAVIETCAARLREYLEHLIVSGKVTAASRIVFVNDGSADRTWQMIAALCASDPLFSGISLSRNFGHQGALLAGLQNAPGDAIISIDADLQDDIAVIETMVDRMLEGHDVVYGVRRERKVDSAFKRLTALGFYRLMNLLGTRTVYNHADFRLLSRRALEALSDYREVNLFLRGIVPLLGFPSAVVTYDRGNRLAGETKYPFRKMLALSLSAITAFSNTPLRLITLTALAGIGVIFLVSAWVIWIRLFTTRGVPGWTSILLPMLFIGLLNLLAIGVVGEYLARIFDEVKARPRYLVATTVNLSAQEQSQGVLRRGQA